MNSAHVSLRKVARVLGAHWITLGIFCLLFTAGSVIYALTREPLYESDSLLAPVKEDAGQLGALSGVLGQFAGIAGGLGVSGGSANEDEAVAVLQSREFSLRFMREHALLPLMFPKIWDAGLQKWRPRNDGTERPAGPSPDDAVQSFESMRTVTVDRRTEFVRLAIRAPTAALARDWSTSMINELNDALRSRALEESQRAVTLLSKSVETEQVQSMRTAAASLLESQLRRQVLAQSRRDYALRILDPPSLPDQRFYPKRTRMVIIGFGLGLLLGICFVLGRRAWRESA
jgi:Chain length determinant protein